jgi:hypothetical protein
MSRSLGCATPVTTGASFGPAGVGASAHAELARHDAIPASEAVTPRTKKVTIMAVRTGFRCSPRKGGSTAWCFMAIFSPFTQPYNTAGGKKFH